MVTKTWTQNSKKTCTQQWNGDKPLNKTPALHCSTIGYTIACIEWIRTNCYVHYCNQLCITELVVS